MQNSENSRIEASREFSVSSGLVYAAWTEPDQLKQWWKPMDNMLKQVGNDIREGGELKYEFEENKFIISGKYLEVKPGERLVYTWNWDFPSDALKSSEYQLTVEFENRGNGSRVKVSQDNTRADENMQPHEDGWKKGLEDLHQFLDSASAEQPGSPQDEIPAQRSGGYNESPEQVKVGGV